MGEYVRRFRSEILLYTLAVAVLLVDAPSIPSGGSGATYDNIFMAQKTARLANNGIQSLFELSDPWFRYVPQAVLARVVSPAGVTLQEAMFANWLYVQFVEVIVLPLVTYLFVKEMFDIRTGRIALGAILVGHIVSLHLPSPRLRYMEPPAGDILGRVAILVSDISSASFLIIPVEWQLLLVSVAICLSWFAYREGYAELIPSLLLGFGLGIGIVGINAWEEILRFILRLYSRTRHWYWGLTGPFAIGAVWGLHRRLTAEHRFRSAVVSGVCLGFVGSIQLAHGFIVASAVAVAYVAYRAWSGLLVTTVTAITVWLPTLGIMLVRGGFYTAQGARVLEIKTYALGVIPVGLVFVGVFSWCLYGLSSRHPRETFLVSLFVGAWFAVLVVRILFGMYWYAYATGVIRPILIVIVAAIASKAVRPQVERLYSRIDLVR
jgi:hypothetical protein